jgi:hypothetical protein
MDILYEPKQDNGLTVICIMDVSLIANSYVFKEPVFNYSGNFRFMDEIKIPVQYGSNYELAKSIILEAGIAVAGELSVQSKEKWKTLQSKYRLEDAQTEPMLL